MDAEMQFAETPHENGSTRRYTEAEKQQLLENLELEVSDRERRFRSRLEDVLSDFLLRQENEITRLPRAIRSLTMEEFDVKYNGDITACLQALAKARMAEGGVLEIDASARKRKYQDGSLDNSLGEGSRAIKTARKTGPLSPSKKFPRNTPTTARRLVSQTNIANNTGFRTNKTPGSLRPSSSQPILPSQSTPSKNRLPTASSSQHLPTLSSFNPRLPKTPAFPNNGRQMRQNESILSANGSPIANPYDNDGRKTPPPGTERRGYGTTTTVKKPGMKRMSSIRVLRDPSLAFISSQSSSQPPSSDHDHPMPSSASSQTQTFSQARTHLASALFEVQTHSGEILHFNPATTSPTEIDDLDISSSAKKKAKEEMASFVRDLASKWTISG